MNPYKFNKKLVKRFNNGNMGILGSPTMEYPANSSKTIIRVPSIF